MAQYHNVRGGTIRLTTDGPVYHGVALEVADSVAVGLNQQPLVKAYIDGGSLVCAIQGKYLGTAKAKKTLFQKYPDLAPKKAAKKDTKTEGQ